MVELTPDEKRRATRALALAEAELVTGNLSAARQVIDQALPRLEDDHLRGLAMRLNGAILFAAGQPAEAAEVLASAARVLTPHASVARETLLEAYDAAVLAGSTQMRRVVDLARSLLPAEAEPTVADLLLEGFAARFTAGYEHSVAPLRAAIRALGSDDLDPSTGLACSGWDASPRAASGTTKRSSRLPRRHGPPVAVRSTNDARVRNSPGARTTACRGQRP